MLFGEKLKELREAAGLTQGALAERAGMHLFGVAKLEQGVREPAWSTVQAICTALGVKCSAFEGTTSAKRPAPAKKPASTKKPAAAKKKGAPKK
ncbi:MAG: helix-turn-helix transcriptional regulator [Planctomycetes bacterium]|nr:helix-turn-helix transcriptional regulator [Planctomycetota bacterium]